VLGRLADSEADPPAPRLRSCSPRLPTAPATRTNVGPPGGHDARHRRVVVVVVRPEGMGCRWLR
jgi:hypothetical protein